ncbi:MAG: hypothetical protein PHR89_02520 [Bacilli bacterium]|nr:hypothetical protein [Bacilli bacterium]
MIETYTEEEKERLILYAEATFELCQNEMTTNRKWFEHHLERMNEFAYRHPEIEEIQVAYGKQLIHLIRERWNGYRKNYDECLRYVNFLARLSSHHPLNEKIAELYAEGLEVFVQIEMDPARRDGDEIVSMVSDIMHNSFYLAVIYPHNKTIFDSYLRCMACFALDSCYESKENNDEYTDDIKESLREIERKISKELSAHRYSKGSENFGNLYKHYIKACNDVLDELEEQMDELFMDDEDYGFIYDQLLRRGHHIEYLISQVHERERGDKAILVAGFSEIISRIYSISLDYAFDDKCIIREYMPVIRKLLKDHSDVEKLVEIYMRLQMCHVLNTPSLKITTLKTYRSMFAKYAAQYPNNELIGECYDDLCEHLDT